MLWIIHFQWFIHHQFDICTIIKIPKWKLESIVCRQIQSKLILREEYFCYSNDLIEVPAVVEIGEVWDKDLLELIALLISKHISRNLLKDSKDFLDFEMCLWASSSLIRNSSTSLRVFGSASSSSSQNWGKWENDSNFSARDLPSYLDDVE